MAITDLTDKVFLAVDQNETTFGIYLDLSKAFDTINHDIYYYINLNIMVLEEFLQNGSKAILVTVRNMNIITPTNHVLKMLLVVFHKARYWGHYYSFCMLMIL